MTDRIAFQLSLGVSLVVFTVIAAFIAPADGTQHTLTTPTRTTVVEP